ncbi:MAG TPA: alpha-L-fucosidase [Marinilabiliales bacterium]|nr:alpha-L-fucosidase [Marinilabiliales bacterium]
MKKSAILFILFLILLFKLHAQNPFQTQSPIKPYTPTPENLAAREWFRNAKFGMFVHWGLYSLLGDGEWVMTNKNIKVKNYSLLAKSFNPTDFNAQKWVSDAKAAGMNYITFVTRHHDGFSMWDTKYSDFNIMNTPCKKDIVRELSDECHKQGVKLFLYYSLLDWRRDDYSWWTGRTGRGTGRTQKGDWNNYILFMKNQLTELLTNYGEISGVWFDGYWDQVPAEKKNRTEKDVYVDWHMSEIYEHIHQLRPACLIGNNHHMAPLNGEDFQMFERDVPGENKYGYSHQAVSELPLETCATINKTWGYSITDETYKTKSDIVNLLVKSAGNGGNLLLNIGPLPNGDIQPEFLSLFQEVENWLNVYGVSIYGTNGGYFRPRPWGCLTTKPGKLFVHILKAESTEILLENFPHKRILKCYMLKDKTPLKFTFKNKTLTLPAIQPTHEEPDQVIVVEVK